MGYGCGGAWAKVRDLKDATVLEKGPGMGPLCWAPHSMRKMIRLCVEVICTIV